jgi:hypothetical protein
MMQCRCYAMISIATHPLRAPLPTAHQATTHFLLLLPALCAIAAAAAGPRRPPPAAPAQGSSCLLQFVTHVNKFLYCTAVAETSR